LKERTERNETTRNHTTEKMTNKVKEAASKQSREV
jgi:hypothetical protein